MNHTLTIKWGTSRGRDTYGYTTASLYENGRRLASCNGGGYDMRGTVFADWLSQVYGERYYELELEAPDKDGRIHSRKHYGVSQYTGDKGKIKRYIDGACGYETVCRLAEAIGLTVSMLDAGSKRDIILVSDTRASAVA